MWILLKHFNVVVVREGIFKRPVHLWQKKKKMVLVWLWFRLWRCFVSHHGITVYEYFHSSVLKVVTWIIYLFILLFNFFIFIYLFIFSFAVCRSQVTKESVGWCWIFLLVLIQYSCPPSTTSFGLLDSDSNTYFSFVHKNDTPVPWVGISYLDYYWLNPLKSYLKDTLPAIAAT